MLTPREVHRQLFHIGLGLIITTGIYYNILSSWALFFIIINGFLLSFISKRVQVPIITPLLDYFERQEVRRSFPGRGPLFFFIGSLLAVQLFEQDIALASIMVLTLGDSVSHLFGAQFGQMKNIFNGKSRKLLEGTLAGAVAGFLGAVLFVPVIPAFLGAVGAMIAEVVQVDFNERTLDDNVIVPLVAGTVMLIVGKVI